MIEAARANSSHRDPLLKCAIESVLPSSKSKNAQKPGNGFKRGRMEIMAQILTFCFQKRSKTRIMYGTNLNYAKLKDYLNFLTSQGLLVQNSGKYIIAEKAYRFLELYTQLNDLLKEGVPIFSEKIVGGCEQ